MRIALAYKQLEYVPEAIHLLKGGGEQHQDSYKKLNPQSLLPAYVEDDLVLTQSLAIIEYLEETHPEPPLLPNTPTERAKIRSLANLIACDTHPLNNLRVLQYLTGTLGLDEDKKHQWITHWMAQGFEAYEAQLVKLETGLYSLGNTPTLADLCLIPQIYNALRFDVDLTPYPNIVRIYNQCMAQPYFLSAAPESQADAY